mmetsp:Transcript_8677/g.7623  ORF Transcript_8677/g.7623 Transcript_8677/m.7623 type:complete len:116 (+) Transcript_8677:1248-1595(+)
MPRFNFSEENKYTFIPIEEKDASNKLPFVYSIKIYEYYVKTSLNYIRCLLYREKVPWAKGIFPILENVDTIIQKVSNIPISSKFLLYLLYGKALERKFVEEFEQIHEIYSNKYVE